MSETIEEAPGPPRRWPRLAFGIGAAVVAAGLLGSWAAGKHRRAEAQREAVATIRPALASLEYDYQARLPSFEAEGGSPQHPPGPPWLRGLIGPEYFQEVRLVNFRQSPTPGQVAALAAFDHLVALQVRDTSEVGDALEHLPPFPRLQAVTIGGPGLTDAALEILARPGKLRRLALDGTAITDRGLAPLLEGPEIHSLELTRSPGLTDAGVAPLVGSHPGLDALNLAGTGIGDATLAAVVDPGLLATLNLRDTKVTDAGLTRLRVGPTLTSLDLGGTTVTDSGLDPLRGLTGLITLSLRKTAVTDSGLDRLAGLAALERLDLAETAVTDAGLDRLAGMNNLATLFLPATITDAGLERLVGLKTLQRLILPGSRITDAGLLKLRPLERLSTLVVNETGVTADGIVAARHALPNLRRVVHESIPMSSLSRTPTALRSD